MKKKQGPRILLADIETAPVVAHVWGLFDQNVGLNQIQSDWHLLSWSAKWLGEPKIFYEDQRNSKVISEDKALLKGMWTLLDEADIVIWQNGKNFDHKKLNARFILNGMVPPSSYKQIDTLQLARKHFGFTSNKLAYMTDKLCKKYKKLEHKKFPGHDMWVECLKGNKAAWREMEKYNKHDVLSLEELFSKLIPWDNTINFNLYYDEVHNKCSCGNAKIKKNGFAFTNSGKFQRYFCTKCGSETRSKENMFSKDKRKSLRMNTRS